MKNFFYARTQGFSKLGKKLFSKTRPGCPVRHDPLPLGCPDGGAQVGLPGLAEDAVVAPALGGVAGDDHVANLDRGHLELKVFFLKKIWETITGMKPQEQQTEGSPALIAQKIS